VLEVLLGLVAFLLTYEFHAMRKEFHEIRKSIETLNISMALMVQRDTDHEKRITKLEDTI
jgi:predicted Holliday junction resolvase-like endonuclease